MTIAQQEAKELIELFTFNCHECDNAKEAALLCAKRIWDALESARVFEQIDYWNEVKEEIKKG
jgi:hypothetical protein